jgi:hypothetical protein
MSGRSKKVVRDAPSSASPARPALPAAHFDRNAAIPVTDLVYWSIRPETHALNGKTKRQASAHRVLLGTPR